MQPTGEENDPRRNTKKDPDKSYKNTEYPFMTREEIVEKVNSLLAEEFEVAPASITPDAPVRETLSLDSLSLVDLVALLQQTYPIKIPAAALREITTFRELYDYIASHLPA